MIEVLETGLVYRNPKPLLKSVHAWHPTLALMDNGDLLAAYDLAEAIGALEYRTYLSRSTDGAKTWSEPVEFWSDRSRIWLGARCGSANGRMGR